MSRCWWARLVPVVAIGVAGLQVPSAAPVSAGTNIVVDGVCTLVDAINAANTDAAVGSCPAGSGDDTITLDQDVLLDAVDNVTTGANGLPVITSPLTIDGLGHVIGRADGSDPFRLFEIGDEVHFRNVILENGQAPGSDYESSGGGAIRSFAPVTIIDSIVRNNSAAFGGGVHAWGSLIVLRSTISGNVASRDGGGINSEWADLTVSHSTVSGNTAFQGGGIYGESVTADISNSTISGNAVAPPKPHLHGAGGIRLGFDSRGTISHSTFANNSEGNGASIWINVYDEVLMWNNIVDNGEFWDCENLDSMRSLGHNMQASAGDCPFDHETDISNGVTNLGPLQDNGGPTETHALLPGSQALDAIPPAQCDTADDQRGVARPQGEACDIGAYEADFEPVLVCGDVAGTAPELAALGYHVIVGSSAGDTLSGTTGNDFILGMEGDDVIRAGPGDDVVCAGTGHDVVSAGNGDDVVHAEDGNDRVWGGNGADVIAGGRGADRLVGGNGPDDISGDGANDSIRGGADGDVLRGGDGRDDIGGDSGDDTLLGEGADDVLRGHRGIDSCDGGSEINGDQAFSCETVVDVP